ncbi:MAG: hypothetical protein C0506_07715 [Anaerolinea sp.]|nr:hypothetical protein [Anaerolinea sp.]
MTTGLFRTNLARFRAATALELGCDEAAFDSHALTVVARPDTARDQRPARVVTFGTGTVISIDPAYLDWARRLSFKKHYDAFSADQFVLPMIAEMALRGAAGAARAVSLTFIPEVTPRPPSLRVGVCEQRIDPGWRAKHLPSGLFANALGDPGEVHADVYWRWGLALIDESGEPVAVAGAYDDGQGLLEIGVDVVRELRGTGLARTVVALISRAIAEDGMTATYYCSASNVRSHRTALGAGFVPVVTNAGVRMPR